MNHLLINVSNKYIFFLIKCLNKLFKCFSNHTLQQINLFISYYEEDITLLQIKNPTFVELIKLKNENFTNILNKSISNDIIINDWLNSLSNLLEKTEYVNIPISKIDTLICLDSTSTLTLFTDLAIDWSNIDIYQPFQNINESPDNIEFDNNFLQMLDINNFRQFCYFLNNKGNTLKLIVGNIPFNSITNIIRNNKIYQTRAVRFLEQLNDENLIYHVWLINCITYYFTSKLYNYDDKLIITKYYNIYDTKTKKLKLIKSSISNFKIKQNTSILLIIPDKSLEKTTLNILLS